jgi:transposase
MSDAKPSKKAEIIRLHGHGYRRDAICVMLGFGQHRVTNALKSFADSGVITEPLPHGPGKKITKVILDFIDIRTLQDAHLSSSHLAGQISDRFRISITPRSVAFQRQMMGFHYEPPRHTQELKQCHIEASVEFCQKMLVNPGSLPLIHFSDGSRFVLGDGKRWVWYHRGDEN